MKNKIIFLVLFGILLIKYSFADSLASSSATNSVDFLDSIIKIFGGEVSNWSTKLLKIAKYLFWFLASLEACYQIAFKKIFMNDLGKMWIFLFVRLFIATFISLIALNVEFYSSIINYFVQIGANIGGYDLNSTGGDISNSSLITDVTHECIK